MSSDTIQTGSGKDRVIWAWFPVTLLTEGQSDLGMVSGDASYSDFLLRAVGQRFPGDQDRI